MRCIPLFPVETAGSGHSCVTECSEQYMQIPRNTLYSLLLLRTHLVAVWRTQEVAHAHHLNRLHNFNRTCMEPASNAALCAGQPPAVRTWEMWQGTRRPQHWRCLVVMMVATSATPLPLAPPHLCQAQLLLPLGLLLPFHSCVPTLLAKCYKRPQVHPQLCCMTHCPLCMILLSVPKDKMQLPNR